MSGNFQIFTGFYDNDPKGPPSKDDVFEKEVLGKGYPMPFFGRALYLASAEGNVIHSAFSQHPSVICRINEYIRDGMPLIVKPLKEQRDEVIADATSLRKIELELVNRWMQPVRLQNPMIVTIKMRPVHEDVVTYG
jgi:hypothetical protein